MNSNNNHEGLRQVRLLALAILAGFAIGIGGIVFLSLDDKVIGALMFTVGLYTICAHGLNLYTGKIGYLAENGIGFVPDLLVIWVGNLLGTMLAAWIVLRTRGSGIAEKAKGMCETKMGDSYLSLLILGIFCGFLMFAAVDGYKKTQNPIILFMGVATFILSGFEHCIADMFYFSVAGMWTMNSVLRILIITLGNSIGGLMIPVLKLIGDRYFGDGKA